MRALVFGLGLCLSTSAFAQATGFGRVNTATATRGFDWTWTHSTTGQIADGTVDFTFETTVDPDGATGCNNGWALNLCRIGTFSTSDGGTGTVLFSVIGAGPTTRRQTVTFTYDGTGAVYTGQAWLNSPNNSGIGAPATAWYGTMSLPSNPAWTGVFYAQDATFPGAFAPGDAFVNYMPGNGKGFGPPMPIPASSAGPG